MFRQLISNPMIQIAGIMTAIYWTVALFFPSNDIQTVLHAMRFCVWIAVAVTYAPAAIIAVMERKITNADFLIVGIVCGGLSTALMGGWSTFYRLLGRPVWMFENPAFGYLICFSVIGGLIHLTAPGAINGKVPARNWLRAGVVVGLGLGIALLIIAAGLSDIPTDQPMPR